MKLILDLSAALSSGELAPKDACEFRLVLWNSETGDSQELVVRWPGSTQSIVLEASMDTVLVYGDVLRAPKQGSKDKASQDKFWPCERPLILRPDDEGWKTLEQPTHFAPLAALVDPSKVARYHVRLLLSRCRIVTHEVLRAITTRPLISLTGGPLLPDGFLEHGERVSPNASGVKDLDFSRKTTIVPLAATIAVDEGAYPDLCGPPPTCPLVTPDILDPTGSTLAREPVTYRASMSIAAQMTFMDQPALVGATFPEELLENYPTSDEAETGELGPLHLHLAWNTIGFWSGFPKYPLSTEPPKNWGFDYLRNNLHLLMDSPPHPLRISEAKNFPPGGDRTDPLLFHSTVRAGRGYAHQAMAAGKRCALVVPVVGTSAPTNADDLFDADNLELMAKELQWALYRARGQHGPLRPLGNLSISTFSGGVGAALRFLNWALMESKGDATGEEGEETEGKALHPNPSIAKKLREIYLFDPPSLGTLTTDTLQRAIRWRAQDPRRVLRLYTQAQFPTKLLQALLGTKKAVGPGVHHSDDGRVTVAHIEGAVFDASRAAAIPSPATTPGTPPRSTAQTLARYQYEVGFNQYHQLFPDLFLVDALRRSRFTEEA